LPLAPATCRGAGPRRSPRADRSKVSWLERAVPPVADSRRSPAFYGTPSFQSAQRVRLRSKPRQDDRSTGPMQTGSKKATTEASAGKE
jgi:hypothetical protein